MKLTLRLPVKHPKYRVGAAQLASGQVQAPNTSSESLAIVMSMGDEKKL